MYNNERKEIKIMVKHNNIAMCILATILTCGIYGLFWLVSIANDINKLDDNKNVKQTSGGMVLLLSIITCGIYKIYWSYKTGERIDAIKNNRGIPTSNNTGILYLILCLFSYLPVSFNHLAAVPERMKYAIACFIEVIGIIVYALMQNEINKLASDKS